MKANRLALVGILLGLAGTVLLALFVTSSSGEKAGETAAVWMARDAGPRPAAWSCRRDGRS